MPIGNYASIPPKSAKGSQSVSAENSINKIRSPFTENDKKYADKLIETEASQVEEVDRQNSFAELREGNNQHTLLKSNIDTNRARLENASSDLKEKAADRGSPLLGAVTYLCLGTCVYAEYSITLSALPFVLNINKNSSEAHILALAVAASMMILKAIIARLIWEPWEATRNKEGLKSRGVREFIGIVFLLFVGLMTVFMISKISEARQEATKVLATPENIKLAHSLDEKKVDDAVYALSICLAINGALFFVIGHTEMKKVSAYQRSLSENRKLQARQMKLEAALANTKKALAMSQDNWERVKQRAALASDHHRNRLLLVLEEALKRRPLRRSNRDVIDDLLASEYEQC